MQGSGIAVDGSIDGSGDLAGMSVYQSAFVHITPYTAFVHCSFCYYPLFGERPWPFTCMKLQYFVTSYSTPWLYHIVLCAIYHKYCTEFYAIACCKLHVK